ncbi:MULTISPECIES: 23S rRNA (uracil(1939)-C(5))-methyltransferase RlmD [Shewanella]|jgi:23S rRNA (uracil1939-C5)-methyltransferase|uniref:23S rRNA (uracil(1939)-C(5))-methyltransferase RlmD n=1 Tax=Shewanella psychromarinicola TaxID=2487742 RepID=A0A3N4E9W2_9GAMM|nr:23S rRNA (uracil(1939)-C(5))-methyltransferase RlmD [Shewanella psychromarinicola]AZG37130.1 23S rRNA (uracil(1939)-C(5))-methyltransferase RlmD [Shewanella psychromarinicola]MCL1083210.1 23S rRNA (uracil(1939)-C(5))-methyltransferase RlmD [Shewanella psychromarinicola]RPA34985.1 23S rRNA (uracil(1939)-C(5))-methyltransferase RlmD [Shewanella psychromarinicola]|tara:strand:- start:21867 stop:23234 length:1368 start_codon:yes stop_codon:yes gene_type:complete
MAQFFQAKPNKSKQLSAKLSLSVTQLDHLGAGIAQHQGKIVFIPGVLPGETATVQFVEQKKSYAKAKLIAIDVASAHRITPHCPHYHQCGGCDLQHMDTNVQRDHKQTSLVDLISKLSSAKTIEADIIAEPLVGEAWHYRRRARLATLFDKNSQRLQLGFRAANSNKIVSIQQCPVLAESLSALITPLAVNLNQLKAKASLGHVELTQADNGNFAVLRVTKVLPASDIRWLTGFAEKHQLNLLLQDDAGQLTQLYPLSQANDDVVALPYYHLAQESVRCSFTPGNFVQVNGAINQAMVDQAIEWLAPQAGERILDLFCGVGNFSLPLARRAAEVIGVEGVPEMVQQAKQNAIDNQLDNVTFHHADLSADLSTQTWLGKIDKLLLDPARAGAFESLQWLQKMQPKKVVYVSCNPASLARDSSVLLANGYRIAQVGLVDMFPQTHHIEAMVLFELDK